MGGIHGAPQLWLGVSGAHVYLWGAHCVCVQGCLCDCVRVQGCLCDCVCVQLWVCTCLHKRVCLPCPQEHVYIYLLDGDTRLLCDDPPHELPPNGKLR